MVSMRLLSLWQPVFPEETVRMSYANDVSAPTHQRLSRRMVESVAEGSSCDVGRSSKGTKWDATD